MWNSIYVTNKILVSWSGIECTGVGMADTHVYVVYEFAAHKCKLSSLDGVVDTCWLLDNSQHSLKSLCEIVNPSNRIFLNATYIYSRC